MPKPSSILAAPYCIEHEVGPHYVGMQDAVALGELAATVYAVLLERLVINSAITALDHVDILLDFILEASLVRSGSLCLPVTSFAYKISQSRRFGG